MHCRVTYEDIYKIPLREGVNLKSRARRKSERGNTEIP